MYLKYFLFNGVSLKVNDDANVQQFVMCLQKSDAGAEFELWHVLFKGMRLGREKPTQNNFYYTNRKLEGGDRQAVISNP